MQIQQINVSDITPYDKNPRLNDAAVPKVAESISKFGFKVPIVIDSNNVIVAGHTRFKAALQLGLESVPCIVADDLSDAQIRAFRLADNKVAEFSEWDFTALHEELEALVDLDMQDFGFMSVDEIDWAGVPELNENTYEEPVKKMLQCPHCQHIADAKLFRTIKSMDDIQQVRLDDFTVRHADMQDIDAIKSIADKYSNEIGFVMRPALEEHCKKGFLLVAESGGEIAGFCNFNKRKDGVSVIYEICTDYRYRGNGVARKMIDALSRPIQLKCPIDNESNNFYAAMGFKLIDVEAGKKRKLNVWELVE